MTFDHFDLYRLEAATIPTLLELGFFEAWERSQDGGYLFVEWPERLAQGFNRQFTGDLKITMVGESARYVSFLP